MNRTQDVTTRVAVLLAALAAMVLGTGPSASPGIGASVLAVALATLVVLAMRQVYLAACVPPVLAVARRVPARSLSGRVTDPTHHPLRPRAPGTA